LAKACFYGHPTLSTWFTSEYKKSGKKLRVSAQEHMANYKAARALMGKGRNAGEGAAGLSKSSAKKGARKSAVKNGAKGMSDMAGKAAR
jgi:hypothetical protein